MNKKQIVKYLMDRYFGHYDRSLYNTTMRNLNKLSPQQLRNFADSLDSKTPKLWKEER